MLGQTGSDSSLNFSETDLSGGVTTSKRVRVMIGTTTGFVLGIITAFIVEAWDDRLRRRQRTEAVTGLPVIAEVPLLPKDQRRGPNDVVVVDAPASRPAERYRSTRSAILFLLNRQSVVERRVGRGHRSPTGAPVVMVTSPSPGEGKTTTVANLAAALGDSDVRTLVIDCDYHNPKIANRLDPSSTPTSSAARHAPASPTCGSSPLPRRTDVRPRYSTIIRDTIRRWRSEFEVVVLDTPPMLTTNDAIDLLGSTDGVVLVLRAGQTRTGPASRASEVLGSTAATCSASC